METSCYQDIKGTNMVPLSISTIIFFVIVIQITIIYYQCGKDKTIAPYLN